VVQNPPKVITTENYLQWRDNRGKNHPNLNGTRIAVIAGWSLKHGFPRIIWNSRMGIVSLDRSVGML